MSIKKLYIYLIKTFLPLLLVSFAISWFVVIMQLLWRFVDDLIGKGIDVLTFIELMFYAAMTVVPLSLILAVLVASLMTFGNLGERLELLAMKSAGIPLYTIMKPVFGSVLALSIGLFIFQNDWMIKAQVKFWAYYFAIRSKSPELAIPTKVFYKELNGYSIYIKEKDLNTKLLKGLMIYDYKAGFNDATVIVADSGRVYSTKDNKALILELYSGEAFKNLKSPSYYNPQELLPYLREKFEMKEVHILFDSNLGDLDEDVISSQFVGKNIIELKHFSDSLELIVDSLEVVAAKEIVRNSYQTKFLPSDDPYVKTMSYEEYQLETETESTANPKDTQEAEAKHSLSIAEVYPSKFDQLPEEEQRYFSISQRISQMGMRELKDLYSRTLEITSNQLASTGFTRTERESKLSLKRKNEFEYHRKMTYPVACLVFFFIGAPLGAIIRKGGLGTPIVTAVLFFIVYYSLESMGYKMARDGKIEVWLGMWLPSMVLSPIGLWLSYIATKDSTKLNIDNYLNTMRKLLGLTTARKISYKDIAMKNVDEVEAMQDIRKLEQAILTYRTSSKVSYSAYFLDEEVQQQRADIYNLTEKVVENLSNSRDHLMINRLANYPYLRDLIPTLKTSKKWINILLMTLLPIGAIVYGIYLYRNKAYKRELDSILKTNQQILELLSYSREN